MMLTDDMRTFFDRRSLIARLSTQGADGYPHAVPIWYLRDGEDIVFISDRDNRKVKNAAANPKAAVVIGGDADDGAGYMIRGDIIVKDAPDLSLIRRLIERYETPEKAAQMAADWAKDDIVALRLSPRSAIKVY